MKPRTAVNAQPRHVACALALLLLACAAGSLTVGLPSPGWPVGWAGPAEAGALARWVLLELRLPRVLAAAAVGTCLAVAGWIFQRLSRNPLASPDIVGLTTGSATGGLVTVLLFGAAPAALPWGALAGGLLTATLVQALTPRRGSPASAMILTGIALAAMLAAVNDYLLTRAELDDAVAARFWLHGSLQAVRWTEVAGLFTLGSLLVAAATAQSRSLDLLEMGDAMAQALGLPVRRARHGLLLVAVALTALVISVAGPVGFVALVAPPLARRLCRGVSHLPSVALTGACLCVASDWVARAALAPFQIPVGLVTSLLGGAYLMVLLSLQWRRGG
ncbi:iron complex transport system permease protein [Sphaerotilus hippei]|uniref:Iron complex transport system permease protein n=1 Tax=Sphaerotilus hippei TaxID=744406 RepID=A0A318GYM1_9BURK|nr:iron chelate uptake ABC transporter family permease subunit [Sphaerotilus hippei]PXW95163.1 iron complex transport system permease protein [Sphaerotilus hippei]